MIVKTTPRMAYRSERCQSYIEPHEIELNTEYCLTINPCKRFTNPLEFKRQIGQYLHDNLQNVYHFYVERSKKGKFHVHGTVQFLSIDTVNVFYDFLQKMEEEGLMSYKFGDMMDNVDEETESDMKTEEDVVPGVEQKTIMSWEDYISKQAKYWEALEFKPKFTEKYIPGITCVFNPKPKKSRSKNPRKKLSNAEIIEQIEHIQTEKDVTVI